MMIKHTCQLPPRQEDNFPFVVIKPLTLKNVWKVWCSVSKYTPKCNHYMDSTAVVTAERRRHAKLKHWWIIHPFSYVRFLWDILMMTVYLIAFLTIPFMICFVVMDYELIRLDKSIVKNLKFELYLPNDVIVKAGAQGDCMFFLSSGTVTVLTPTGKEICHLDDGAHFGEVALLVADQRRVASVIAIEVCEVYRLDRKDFRQCIDVNSELFAEIERIATERVERTVRIEEQHKRFMMRPNNLRGLRLKEKT
ncbi:hypothetical protein DMN91_013020 [Ooceraea biroi]|uniref:Cyclic nucleotide-binding domain-containing protein n=1 Tax=Ooceraea biroi TaxID=2015173 RepID=A0A3L8D545_OOCBI|nr:hypothetical protein DMN91_013020 [Ooceraea biroi]